MPDSAPIAPRAPRPCDLCGTVFTPYRDWQKFCCPEHRAAAYKLTHIVTVIPLEHSVPQTQPSGPVAQSVENKPDQNKTT